MTRTPACADAVTIRQRGGGAARRGGLPTVWEEMNMSEGNVSVMLYDPSDNDLSQVLLRCCDLLAFICQTLYPGSDPAGHKVDPKLSHVDPPATLHWWLCSLRVTLESLSCTLATSPPDALTTALQAYLAQHPEQAPALQRVLVAALAHGFVQWDQMLASIASAPASGASSEPRGEGEA
jgi:hypothetical protein